MTQLSIGITTFASTVGINISQFKKRGSREMSKEFKDLPVKLDNAFWELLDILVTRGVLNPKDRKTIEEAYEE